MTVAPGTGSEVATWDSGDDIGLEDVNVGDVVLPRLSIVHDEAVFQDNQSKQQFDELEVIILGLVKQRIMWDSTVDEGDKPQCKSPDAEHGFPNTNPDAPKDKRFPWDESNFNPANFSPDPERNDLIVLPCNSCVFAQWTKENGKSVPPRCSEQHTYPLLYNSTPGALPEDQIWQPALISFQRTGIKPSRQYLSGFAQAKRPMFTVHTTISLTPMKRGTVKYAVPVFKKGDSTDRDSWDEFANQYRQIREFIRSAPRNTADEESTEGGFKEDSNVNAGPEKAAATPAAPAQNTPVPEAPKAEVKPEVTPEPESNTGDDEDDNGLPF